MADAYSDWKVNTPQLYKEIVECMKGGEILRTPLRIMMCILGELATYAIKKNDPELNVLMMRLALYDIPPSKVQDYIDAEREKMKVPPQ